MKRTIIFFVFVAAVASTASAATKCVGLDATKSASVSESEQHRVDWTVTEQNGTVLKGVGVCSSSTGSDKEKSDTIQVMAMSGYSGNLYCWCKITAPVDSVWVYYGSGTADYCAQYCGPNCADAMTRPDFRAVIFDSLQ